MKPLAGAEVSDFGTRFGFEAVGSKNSELRPWPNRQKNRRAPQAQVHGTSNMFVSARPLNRYIDHSRCRMSYGTADSLLNPNRSLPHMPGFW